jgi:hypothetical protein
MLVSNGDESALVGNLAFIVKMHGDSNIKSPSVA